MIPARSGIILESTLHGENVRMEIDQSALTHIMGVLTDLYADPELAVIREYSTNALDAQVEAGNPQPIEVTTPSTLSPVFVVRDFGEGLDAEDIRSIYSRYGVSTKRSSNDAVGMLGLGCKAALSYVDQFTLTGVKNGVKTTVSVSRAEDGTGNMKILATESTDEPSGVTVSVPSKRGHSFGIKARAFFRFWKPGTVLLDGEQPPVPDGLELSPDLLVIDKADHYSDPDALVVMGNVPYPAPEFDVSLPRNKQLVARVGIGAVQFAPSREALQDSHLTRTTLEGLERDFTAAAMDAVQREIDAADTRFGALLAAERAAEALGLKVGGHQWRKQDIETNVRLPLPTGVKPDTPGAERQRPSLAVGSNRYGRVSKSDRSSCSIIDLAGQASERYGRNPRYVIVTHFTNAAVTGPQCAKLDRFRNRDDEKIGTYMFLPGPVSCLENHKWLPEDIEIIDWPDVRKWKDPNKPQAVNSYAGTYPACHSRGERDYNDKYEAAEIAKHKRIYYTDADHYRQYELWNLATKMIGACCVARVPSTRLAKFKRTFPNAIDVRTAIKAKAQRRWERLPEQERQDAVTPRGSVWGVADPNAVPAGCDDPGLAAIHDWLQRDAKNALKLLSESGGWIDKTGTESHDLSILKEYPLLSDGNSATIAKHNLIYVNAVYAARQKESK